MNGCVRRLRARYRQGAVRSLGGYSVLMELGCRSTITARPEVRGGNGGLDGAPNGQPAAIAASELLVIPIDEGSWRVAIRYSATWRSFTLWSWE